MDNTNQDIQQCVRDEYKLRESNKLCTTRNEPPSSIIKTLHILEKDIIEYPDMKRAYLQYASALGLNPNGFLLTNGCESALRITLSALKRIYGTINLHYENPTWGMLPVIAEQLQLEEVKTLNYKYNKSFNMFSLGNDIIKHISDFKENDVIYLTYEANNLFPHDNTLYRIISMANATKATIVVDATYARLVYDTNPDCFHELIPDNIIFIGSLSKIIGCGVRIGHIIYKGREGIANTIVQYRKMDKFSEYVNLYRDEYITALGAKVISRLSRRGIKEVYDKATERLKYIFDSFPENSFSDEVTTNDLNIIPVYSTANYVTCRKKFFIGDKRYINKEFKVSGISFVRLGIPKSINCERG